MRPKVPAATRSTTRMTRPATMVRPSDWKMTAIGFSFCFSVERAKSLSRLAQRHSRAAVRRAALQALAVARHRVAENEIHGGDRDVRLDPEARPGRLL